MSGWDWFDPTPDIADDGTIDHWQACFADAAGQRVLTDLERQILHTALGPDANSQAIWMREGQRALVLQIRRLATENVASRGGGDGNGNGQADRED
ncbi:MAG: hypothetical protein KTR23_08910 [Rhodospirillales bacterium]|nr:hypothetical protein [Rhodospirillales bacterium]